MKALHLNLFHFTSLERPTIPDDDGFHFEKVT